MASFGSSLSPPPPYTLQPGVMNRTYIVTTPHSRLHVPTTNSNSISFEEARQMAERLVNGSTGAIPRTFGPQDDGGPRHHPWDPLYANLGVPHIPGSPPPPPVPCRPGLPVRPTAPRR